jgi:hypothetical protein
MATVRAKFKVTSIEYYESPAQSARVKMAPVYSSKNAKGEYVQNEENKSFWQATPTGELWMHINNPSAVAAFVVGNEYYLDFTPALPPTLTES